MYIKLTHTCTHTSTRIHSHTHTHSCTHTHTHTHIRTHMHTHPHAYYLIHTHSLAHSQLMAMGMTKEEITHRVKEKAISESESIYGTLYGTLGEEGGMDEP